MSWGDVMSMYIISGRNDGLPCIPDVPDVTTMLLIEPVPEYVLRITAGANEGLPYTVLPWQNGAFMDAAQLTKVRIPSSVKRIGELAFSGTRLKTVKIARDCEFSETSFPEGCEVTYYTSDGSYSGNYGQLLDCDGKIVLDKSAARVYVKE